MKISTCVFFFIILTLFLNCSGRKRPVVSEQEIRETQEALVGVNRLMVQRDREEITGYLEQHKLNLQESKSGLWYGITSKGQGKPVQTGMRVTLKYNLSLINGTPCYSSDSLGPKQFLVGQGGVESGLEEGVLLLREGDQAVFIMPPHLAHGLTGDGDRIPARSIIIYNVELLKVEP
jgi:FKBP-type peptidyl-prolyl cis-trans isomerase FkpA